MAPQKEPPDEYKICIPLTVLKWPSLNIYCGKMLSGRSCPFHSYYCKFSETWPFSYDDAFMNEYSVNDLYIRWCYRNVIFATQTHCSHGLLNFVRTFLILCLREVNKIKLTSWWIFHFWADDHNHPCLTSQRKGKSCPHTCHREIWIFRNKYKW